MKTIDEALRIGGEKGTSDVHITPGRSVMFRIDGTLREMGEEKDRFKEEDILPFIEPILTPEIKKDLSKKGEVDFAYSLPGVGRYRVNVFMERGALACAIRILPFKIPEPEVLRIPPCLYELTKKKRGLVLVTGATGSGKSTTLASLINLVNKSYSKHIITLEDPIEYLHPHVKSIVNQREIGRDSLSYSNALRAALRQDPDVILVGEMRDLETISIAITAAETGHLVFSTLHTNSAASTIDRVIDVFPPHQQQQIRTQLANVIECVVAQQLLPLSSGKGRAGAFEVMLANPAIRNLIREAKTFQIPSTMQTCKHLGMQTMDDALMNLYYERRISGEDAINYSHDPVAMRKKIMM